MGTKALITYRGLEVWKVSMNLVVEIYRLTAILPSNERFGLTSQLRRAAISIPTNIAEGYGRSHRGDYLHHLSFARGSLMEIETLLAILIRLDLVTRELMHDSWKLSQQTGRMLTRQIASLKAKRATP